MKFASIPQILPFLASEDAKHCCTRFSCTLDDLILNGAVQEISQGKLKLLQGDATRLDLRPVFQGSGAQPERWKVVANLPFNISTEILKILLPMGDIVSDVYVMLQASSVTRPLTYQMLLHFLGVLCALSLTHSYATTSAKALSLHALLME